MNEKMGRELSKLFKDSADNIIKHMMADTHQEVPAYQYKEMSRSLTKMCDMIEIFAWVN